MSQRMPRDDVHGVVVGIGDDGVGSLGEDEHHEWQLRHSTL
jgi:hypothetical protein